jgi:hypothetical protein
MPMRMVPFLSKKRVKKEYKQVPKCLNFYHTEPPKSNGFLERMRQSGAYFESRRMKVLAAGAPAGAQKSPASSGDEAGLDMRTRICVI